MASKKKSAGDLAPLRKALSGLERTQRELQLNIKNLKTAMGHIHKAGGEAKGHPHGAASGRMKGHVHSPSGMAKGHVHSATSGKAKGHPHSA
jgi:hypothetical protein